MDPLSIAASVITVLATAVQVKRKLKKLSGLLRHANEKVSALLYEVILLQSILQAVKSIIDQHRATNEISVVDDLLQTLNDAVVQESSLVKQLDEIIHYRLLRPDSGTIEGHVLVVRRHLLREQNKLAQLQEAISKGRQDIQTILIALNT